MTPVSPVDRVKKALGGLDALGITSPSTLDALTDKAGDVRRLLAHMTIPGGSARWLSQLSEKSMRWTQLQPSEARWSHVSTEERRALQEAYFAMYSERIERPKRYPCPPENGRPAGCLLCGVSHIEELPSIARKRGVWIEAEADPAAVGGHGAESVDGHVCHRCDEAVSRAGGIGQSAMSCSVLDYLGVPQHIRAFSDLDGLRAWAVLPVGTAPNREPWGHVYLDELREQVRAFARAAGASFGDHAPLQRVR